MNRLLAGGMLSAVIALGVASSANAQVAVERSGNVYHKAVCGPVVGHYARCHAHIVTDHAGNPLFSGHPPVGGLGPSDLRDAYKATATGSPSTIIAIVDAFGYDNAEADLGTYRTQFGLPACTTANGCFKKLNQRGKQKDYPAQDIGWADESALDLDMASAMCPGCTIYLIEADDNSFENLAAAVNEAAKLHAHVISNSYGGDESGSDAVEASYDHKGVAITASTGDSGYGVQFPASSPHVTAVGGTKLVHDTNSRGWSETVWSGAGSGCSTTYAKPKWQKDKGCAMRTVGDVAADADPSTGVSVFGPHQNGVSGWLVFGGTSVAAPLIGGVYGANGGTVSFGSNPYKNTSALFDVVSGSNGTCTPPNKNAYLCTGKVGYDGPTGFGTPNGGTAFGTP